MSAPDAHARTLRLVALTALDDARAAWREAEKNPSEQNTLAALRLCTLAKRALLRASEHWPDYEEDMIERALLIGELTVGLSRSLARAAEQQQP